jgi:hypothetical protein
VSSENVELERGIAERMAPDEFVAAFHDAETVRSASARASWRGSSSISTASER